MSLKSYLGFAALIVSILSAAGTSAGRLNQGYIPRDIQRQQVPPPGYDSQWWIHPNGCEYSKAGRPGEIVWYLIINSVGTKRCVRYVVEMSYGDGAYGIRKSTK